MVSIGPGTFPDVYAFGGVVFVAYQAPAGNDALYLHVRRYDRDLTLLTHQVQPLGPESQAYPRLGTLDGRLHVIYRDGATVMLGDLRTIPWRAVVVGPGFGEFPSVIDANQYAWMPDAANVFVAGPATRFGRATHTSQGISRIRADGWPVLVDEDRRYLTSVAKVDFVGDLMAGEYYQGGVLVVDRRTQASRVFMLGENTLDPRITMVDEDHVAAVTWGAPGEIRLWNFRRGNL